ncbi:hypothetical protein [Sphingomonas sp. Leaf21]|nr:hypothetical protein [Sphingomonas sp. Leaf21]
MSLSFPILITLAAIAGLVLILLLFRRAKRRRRRAYRNYYRD